MSASQRNGRSVWMTVAAACLSAVVLGSLCAARLVAQAPPGDDPAAAATPKEDVATASLPLRTALHHDPSLDAPLERLVTLYREAGRINELVELYRQHTAAYPADPNGAAVLVRLLEATADPQAAATARSSAEAHPNNPYLQYLLYQSLRRTRRSEATAALERAVSLTNSPRQKAAWIEALLDEAASGEQPELVDKYLEQQAAEATTPDAKLEIAARMAKYRRFEAALAVLDQAAGLGPAPETSVRIQLDAAGAEIALDRAPDAAARLDRLLEKLAPDYWQRAEIVRRRISLITSEEERTRLVDAAKKRYAERPTDDATAADLASLLIGFEQRREALAVLLEASERLPNSQRLEALTLDLLDRLRDERARRDYLSAKLKASPQRADLLALHVKSLLVVGDRTEARRQIARLVEVTPEADRAQVQIELARALLKSNPTSDIAAEVLQRVVDGAPERFDLRRELAELYVRSGNRGRARDLFTVDLPDDLPVESVLDFIPFLIEQEMFAEARKALRKAIGPDDPNLDLRLLAADVERRTGNRAAAARMLTDARKLADTPALYKLWLEAAATLHEEDETFVDFLADEQQRLDAEGGEWTEARIERVAALLEIAGRGKGKEHLADLASFFVDDETVPAEVRTQLRRQVVRVLAGSTDADESLAGQLEELIDALPDAADEYRGRLALLYVRANQHHLVDPLLGAIRVAQIADPQLLIDLERVFTQFNRRDQAAAVLERLIVLEPAEKSHWEAWLYQLALSGREERLRDALRRLLSGIDGVKLDESIRELLQRAEIDSYGRTILASLVDGREGPLSEALTLLAAVEKRVTTSQQALWLCWNRAFILNRLNRPEERDEAIGEMEKLFGEFVVASAAPPEPPPGGAVKPAEKDDGADPPTVPEPTMPGDFRVEQGAEPRLRFPDGLSLSMANARRLLTATQFAASWPKADARTGPLAPLHVEWALDFPTSRAVEQICPTSRERLVVVDSDGGLTGVDAVTGKVVWERPGVLPAPSGELHLTLSRTVRGQSSSQNVRVRAGRPTVAADERNRLFYAHRGEVVCLSATTGDVLWKSTIDARYELGQTVPAAGKSVSHVFIHGAEVLACDPENDVVASVDAETGRLLWTHDVSAGLPPAESRMLHWMNSGAAFDGRRLFVYGPRAALFDVERREVQWTIDPLDGDRVPVRLDARPPVNATTAPYGAAGAYAPATVYPSTRYVNVSVGGSTYPSQLPSSYTSYSSLRSSSQGYYGGAVPIATGGASQYLDYQRRGATTTTSSPRSPTDTTLVGPAAKWSADSAAGQPRFAALNENRLLLGATEGCSIMDTDLPLAGRRLSTVGTYVGNVGHTMCCLRGNELVVVELSRGLRGSLKLTSITGGEYNARVQTAIDGPLVYLTGPQGIYCFNVLSRRRVFTTPWPPGALLEADDPRRPPETDLVDQSTHYLWSGSAVAVGPSAACVRPVGVVAEGRLYTAATPWRVVALGGIADP